jgi:hypothetical protein
MINDTIQHRKSFESLKESGASGFYILIDKKKK